MLAYESIGIAFMAGVIAIGSLVLGRRPKHHVVEMSYCQIYLAATVLSKHY